MLEGKDIRVIPLNGVAAPLSSMPYHKMSPTKES